MLLAPDAFADLERLQVQRLRLVVAALILLEDREAVHGAQRARMLLAQDAFLDLQRLQIQRLRLFVAALILVQVREASHGP